MPSWGEIFFVAVMFVAGYLVGYFELLKVVVIKERRKKKAPHGTSDHKIEQKRRGNLFQELGSSNVEL